MLGNIFYDYRGDFLWSSAAAGVSLLAAILSIIGFYINRKTQKGIAKQQIDANLKAKARVDWISEVRELVSIYIYELFKVQNILIKIKQQEKILFAYRSRDLPSIDEEAERVLKEEYKVEKRLTELFYELEILYYNCIQTSERILLNFSKKEDHDNIESTIKEAVIIVKGIYNRAKNRTIDDPDVSRDEGTFSDEMTKKIEEISIDLRDTFRNYLKIEWDIAKEGK